MSELVCPDCGPAPVKSRPRYGFWKWVMLLGGGTPIPDELEFYCERCDRGLVRTRFTPAKPSSKPS